VNASHHRAARSGTVTGRAVPQRLGRQLATWQVEIRDEENHLTCTARVTCLLSPL
jgi:1,4-dihydroxy-2-naphthoyl-CoA hydrolase